MRVPVSWLRSYVDLPAGEDARSIGERFVRAGLKVEAISSLGADVQGPVVVGRVVSYEDLSGLKKPIRYCQVDVGEARPRGIVCGATNFAAGDVVAVSLPGSVLPGGFAIAARKTYGHVSDGMICSARELGLGDDSAGILVLPSDIPVGADAVEVLGLRNEVLELEVTPDRGYALSLRGVAREAATAYALPYADPAAIPTPAPTTDGYPVRVADPAAGVFVARTVTGIDPAAPTPLHLQQRLRLAGMRPVSLVVDVTNYVMLELGQPLAAYDRDRLHGALVARRAGPAETLETLDGAKRELDPDDLVIADESGAIGIAGVMGGASTEIGPGTRDVVIESAHFDPVTVSRTARRHRLHSEAARRFARGVDPALQAAAAERAVELLVAHGGGRAEPGVTVVGAPVPPVPIALPAELPARVVGTPYPAERVVALLQEVGCRVQPAGDVLEVTPPTWRPDLTDPYDLVEEVARLHGYEAIPSVLPRAPAGRGLTEGQQLRRRVGRVLAGAGFVEAPSYPFVGPRDWAALGLEPDDERRRSLRLVNPLSDEEPELRTTLLPGLLATLRRNLARGATDVALFETGTVFRPEDAAPPAPRPPVDRRPSSDELAALDAALPRQPHHLGAVLAG
ncbi:MAG: phenylalanine--tRNA ligase subunit beta, partial [Actinomycetota bacterium]|nr:phenylalanine--tRNA ligase subunit beta [Actinomycetota bacterium]